MQQRRSEGRFHEAAASKSGQGRRPLLQVVRLDRYESGTASSMDARETLRHLGPGIISGISDLDPTTVATLAIIGSALGYQLLWVMTLLLPMLITVQVVSARIGVATQKGLEAAIRERFGMVWAVAAMCLAVSVNILTLAADLEGGAEALQLLTGVAWRWFVVPIALVLGALLLFGSYSVIQRVLRYVLVVFGAYIIAGFMARPDWLSVIYHALVPSLSLNPAYVAGVLALLGTVLTSYVYFWEAIEAQEERRPIGDIWLVEMDAAVGIVAALTLSAFIILTTAATTGTTGTPVHSAEEAARALVPLAGPLAGEIFALGLLASALLAVPVLASTTAYILSEAFQWGGGLDSREATAHPFYAVLLGSLAIGVAVALAGVEPFQILFIASIAGGLGAPVLLALMIMVARDPEIMRDHPISGALSSLGWLTTVVLGGASILYVIQQFLG
ncbi:MAG TPA: divalent metal cation transporter [Chloroflexota bacterium]|nr:divalent metal cation transporter [Chloroflexota bacterium]